MESRYGIRPLTSPADYAACVELQHETWGPDFGEAVPPAILKVTQRLGGVAAGSFDDDGRLLGFVFGMTGVENGRVVHWSDMLAVRPEMRDSGLGRRLKEWQRDAARAVGATTMYWTFDPLVARNAHLNFNRLGARAHEYVRDMYGDAMSGLHRGLGTDRMIVAWAIDAPLRHSACPSGLASELPPELADARRITIPENIHDVLAANPAKAAEWRRATRAAWEAALGDGLEVACFYREPTAAVGHYVLTLPARQ